jgi:hypothetical protein
MSYPKKHPVNPKGLSGSQKIPAVGKLPEDKREKLMAIQQREQLKGLLVNKFLEKYGKDKSINNDVVNREVANFIKNEKLTEDNLRRLEQRIKDGSANAANGNTAAGNNAGDALYQSANGGYGNAQSQSVAHLNNQRRQDDDEISVTSSQKPKSVYHQGDEDDEWATMLRHDTEIFKKEKELEKYRDLEQKRRMKEELDRQIQEKNKVKDHEVKHTSQYNEAVGKQLVVMDNKEKKKEQDMKNKILQEKVSRDKQLHEEYVRKKLDKKTEKELDELLVRKIKEEMENENRLANQKRDEERLALKKLLEENEENRLKTLEENKRLKAEEVRSQQETIRLMEKQENDRANEVKARELRSKKLMGIMEQTVIKDQKLQILEEERKLLKYYQDRENKEIEDENARKKRLNDMKKDVKNYLDKQKNDKDLRKEEENQFNKKQADIWKKDTQEFYDSEKHKMETIKDINLRHADVLKSQIEEERKRKQKKMSVEELLLNKQKLKHIAEQPDTTAKFQKAKVIGAR